MKKIIQTFTLFIASMLLLTACSENDTQTPELNKHYSQLPSDLSALFEQPVVEVFSLTCGHCLQMEQFIPEIEKEIDQPIGKVHVTFNESAQQAALFYYSAAIQNPEGKPSPQMMSELFNIYHGDANRTQEEKAQQLESAFHDRGYTSPYDFDESQQKTLFAAVDHAIEITGKSMINSVPTFVVNGKYIVITSAHEDIKAIANTIRFLRTQG
jgi:protein-disulfide isomerase